VLVKRFFFLLNAAVAIAILDLISQAHLPSFVSINNNNNNNNNNNTPDVVKRL
jgi:hypothetical protein